MNKKNTFAVSESKQRQDDIEHFNADDLYGKDGCHCFACI